MWESTYDELQGNPVPAWELFITVCKDGMIVFGPGTSSLRARWAFRRARCGQRRICVMSYVYGSTCPLGELERAHSDIGKSTKSEHARRVDVCYCACADL